MGRAYQPASEEVIELLQRVTDEHHEDLADEKVYVAVLMVHPELDKQGRPKAPALMCHGHPALAKIRLANVAERVLAKYDAVMEINAPSWEKYPEESRLALLDHELEHLVICESNDGAPRRHGDGRPKLALRPDDWMFTGFASIVDRHGEHAPEVIVMRNLHERCQGLFAFMEAGEPVSA